MAVAASPQAERAELEALLESGIFDRAPNLARFLKYVCERYFEGEADQIKEYSIAVEALGRPLEFDQKKDSIVRVEAHLLRKRLSQYYAGPGAEHAFRIVIPNGQYAPQFVLHELAHPGVIAPPLAAPPDPAPVAPETPPRSRHLVRNLLVSAGLLVALGAMARQMSMRTQGVNASVKIAKAPADEVWSGDWAAAVSGDFRLLAGRHGVPFIDRQGHSWEPDAYYKGGVSKPIALGQRIEGLPDPSLLRSYREGAFTYDIPLRPGVYELHLYFAETEFGGNTGNSDIRCFQVRMNDQGLLNLFDPGSEAGALNRLHVRVFKDVSPAKDGKLHLAFSPQTAVAFLNALEILPSAPGRIRPIRIAMRKVPVTDARGQIWSADEYAIGGHLVERYDAVRTAEANLFQGERFGNFSYRIPVAPGRYQLTLRFAETYFGSKTLNAPPAAIGARLFNVFANGVALLRNLDILKEAGGPNGGLERTFRNLQPNAQGLIVLEFMPIRNYACVNAIEIAETE